MMLCRGYMYVKREVDFLLKGIIHPKMKILYIYTPSGHSKPV